MEEINYSGESGDIRAALVLPEGDEKLPGVIVVHEVWGLNAHIKDVAGRLGEAGFMDIATLQEDGGVLIDRYSKLAWWRPVWTLDMLVIMKEKGLLDSSNATTGILSDV